MKRLDWVRAIVLGLVMSGAFVVADSEEHSVTAAVNGAFDAGAELGPVALHDIDVGTGVFLGADGSAKGTFHAVLHGSALGSSRDITVEGNVTEGSIGPDGRATFHGAASVDLGDGMPPLPNVFFRVIAGEDGIVLSIDSTTLPAAGIAEGAISIE
jgi:hypothetical protein